MLVGKVSARPLLLGAVLAVAAVPVVAAPAAAAPMFGGGPVVHARASEPVVITGSDIPTWSRAAATGTPAPWPSGVSNQYSFNGVGGDNVRSAHNGLLTVPPDTRTGVDPDRIAAYRWDGTAWTEIPVQVDQMFPYFLANGHSSFSVYSGTDTELTYAWNPTAHSIGEESWKMVFGGIEASPSGYTDANPCDARYEQAGAAGDAEYNRAVALGIVSPSTVFQDDYRGAMQDPVNTAEGKAELNDDDQIAMMAGDAGLFAPSGTAQPAGTDANNGQQITIVDPTAPADGSASLSYIYLFLKDGGSSFKVTPTTDNGYVQLTPDSNAYQWIDRYSFSPSDPEKIGTSNTSYGPNLSGEVCVTDPNNDGGITTPNGTPRASTDRQPRDGMTITTPTYRVYASGRWLVRQVNVTAPSTMSTYGPDLIDRWKGRAFQSSPDSSISLVGFEDEQVNWEMNSAVLGWKVGPVRAIREIWGADSGTNVTKTEIYYRDAYDYQYHVRVHPIPPDGLYTSWDFNYGAVTTYYNQKNPAGIAIDGRNALSAGEIDSLPVTGQAAYFNTCVPTQDICSAIRNPEEISGPYGSLVFVADFDGPSSIENPLVVPYYRDDACFDDGTGDSPVPRPYPGDASSDPNVENGYVQYWRTATGDSSLQYSDLKCAPPAPGTSHYQQLNFASYDTMAFQGAIGEMGLHFFATSDTDNAFNGNCVSGSVVPVSAPNGAFRNYCVTELQAEQWAYTVPSAAPTNYIDETQLASGTDYGNNVVAPVVTFVVPFDARTEQPALPEVPAAALLPLVGFALLIPLGARRRARRRAG